MLCLVRNRRVLEQGLTFSVFPPDLNITNIALIPKGSTQVSMKDWHHIALCNVLYKIISKVLENRLKDVLPQCISDNQTTFVLGRSCWSKP